MLRKITYRRALQNDWDNIARVSQGVYEGQDYLPTVYSSWMVEEETEDPIRFNFVAVLGEAVVGFFSLLFTSDRSAFILSAERVSREVQRRGIGADICRFAVCFAKEQQKSPDTPVHQFVSFADAFISDDSLKRKLVAEGRLLLTLAAPFFLLNVPDLVKRAKRGSFNSSSLRVAEDLTEFWRGPHWSRLVPSGVLHVNWDPFRPAREDDLTYILNPKTRTLVKGADSFSIFTKALRVPAGLRVGLDIFTTDLETFLHHVDFQLSLFYCDIPDEDVPCRLFIFTPPEWIKEVFRHLEEEHGLGADMLVQMGGHGREYPTAYFCTKEH